MALLAEGIWPCVVLSGTSGEDGKGFLNVQINVRFTDGPNKDRLATYEDQVNNKSSLYIARSCKAVGWQGRTILSLGADIAAFVAKTGGKTTAEVKHLVIKNGKRAGEIWDKVNSIGRGPRVLKEPTKANLADADEAMRNALALDGSVADESDAADDDRIPF